MKRTDQERAALSEICRSFKCLINPGDCPLDATKTCCMYDEEAITVLHDMMLPDVIIDILQQGSK